MFIANAIFFCCRILLKLFPSLSYMHTNNKWKILLFEISMFFISPLYFMGITIPSFHSNLSNVLWKLYLYIIYTHTHTKRIFRVLFSCSILAMSASNLYSSPTDSFLLREMREMRERISRNINSNNIYLLFYYSILLFFLRNQCKIFHVKRMVRFYIICNLWETFNRFWVISLYEYYTRKYLIVRNVIYRVDKVNVISLIARMS